MSNVYYKLYYHIVWGTKNKKPIIDNNVENIIRHYLPIRVKNLECNLIEYNMVDDHMLILCSIPPSKCISEFINKLKGSLSYEINIQRGNNTFYWQKGYGVLTLSEKGIPFVRKYIRNQKISHRSGDTLSILEEFTK